MAKVLLIEAACLHCDARFVKTTYIVMSFRLSFISLA
jgi:hypothetical protein